MTKFAQHEHLRACITDLQWTLTLTGFDGMVLLVKLYGSFQLTVVKPKAK